jgi:Bacterial Ig domain
MFGALVIALCIGLCLDVAQVSKAGCPPQNSAFSVKLISPRPSGIVGNVWCIASVTNGESPIKVQFVVITNALGQSVNTALATLTNPPYVFVANQTNTPPGSIPRWAEHNVDLIAVAQDALGNSVTSAPVEIGGIQSGGAPWATGLIIVSPAAEAVLSNGAPLTVSIFFRSLAGVPLPVDVFAGTNLLGTVNPWPGLEMINTPFWVVASAPYTLTVSNLPPGNYELTARSGPEPPDQLFTGISPPVHITVLPADIPPTVSLAGLAYPATTFMSASVIRLEAETSDRDGTVTQVNFYEGPFVGAPIVTSLGTASNSPFVLLLTNKLASGYHVIRAEAVDDGGQTNSSALGTLLVTTNQPGPPVVDIASPPTGTRLRVGMTFPVEAALRASDNNVNPVEFYVGTNRVGSVLDPPYRLMVSNLAVGTYTLSARIKSLSGLASTGAVAQVTMSDFLLETSGMDGASNLRLHIGGLRVGTTNELQFSPDLTNWVTLATRVATTNTWDFADPEAHNDCERFYRCVRLP